MGKRTFSTVGNAVVSNRSLNVIANDGCVGRNRYQMSLGTKQCLVIDIVPGTSSIPGEMKIYVTLFKNQTFRYTYNFEEPSSELFPLFSTSLCVR